MTSRERPSPRVDFIGVGPGDPALLTIRARELLTTADLVIADIDVPAVITSLASAPVHSAIGDGAAIAAMIVDQAQQVSRIARVVTGDVAGHPELANELDVLRQQSIAITIVPGIPTALAAAAYAGQMPFGSVTVAQVRSTTDVAALGSGRCPLLMQVPAAQVADVAAALAAAGCAENTPVWATSAASLPTQQTIAANLNHLAASVGDLSGPLTIGVGTQPVGPWWEERALFGYRVLIPQTTEIDPVVLASLAAYGATWETVRTLSVEPPRSLAKIHRAVKGLVDGRYQWAVFTSVNAVRAIADQLAEFGLDSRALAGVRVAAAGADVRRALTTLGITADLATGGGQDELTAVFASYDDLLDAAHRVLLPRAEIATEACAAGLRAKGWEVEDVTAYRTVRAAPPPAAIREQIKGGAFTAVLFTTASTVRNLIGIAGKPHSSTQVACLGPRTAEAAIEHGLRVDVLPDRPEVGALVQALAAHAQLLRSRQSEGQLPFRQSSGARRLRRR